MNPILNSYGATAGAMVVIGGPVVWASAFALASKVYDISTPKVAAKFGLGHFAGFCAGNLLLPFPLVGGMLTGHVAGMCTSGSDQITHNEAWKLTAINTLAGSILFVGASAVVAGSLMGAAINYGQS